MLSIPPVPRPLLVGINGLWWIYFAIGIYIANSATPEQVWWLKVWNGGLGGNGFSAFGATVLGLILAAEVIFMVFTWAGNRRRIMDAEKAARETVEKATKEAAERVTEAEEAAEKATREAAERATEAEEAAEKAAREAAERATEAEEAAEKAAREAAEQAAREAAEQARKERDREWLEWLEAVKPDLEAGRPPSVPPPFRGNGSAAV